jgi:hypothetical protein
LNGYDIFFFVAIALLKSYEGIAHLFFILLLNKTNLNYIARLLAADLDVCMQILGSTMSVPDDDRFMRNIEKLYEKNVKDDTIQSLRKEYRSKHQ